MTPVNITSSIITTAAYPRVNSAGLADGSGAGRKSYRRSGLVPYVCEWCGAAFQTERRKLREGRGRLCSVRCAQAKATTFRRDQSGEKNPAWKGGVSRNHYRYTLRFRQRHPEKYRAQYQLDRAIRAGRLARPDACSKCGAPCKPHGHHDDYAKPLQVRWLCRACHRTADAERQQVERLRKAS